MHANKYRGFRLTSRFGLPPSVKLIDRPHNAVSWTFPLLYGAAIIPSHLHAEFPRSLFNVIYR